MPILGSSRTRALLVYFVVATVLYSAGVSADAAESAGPRPNVLFIVSDDLNTDLGCYGHPVVQSPHIDALARRSVKFTRAYCQFPLCNPSRSSFLTGLYPLQTGALSNQIDFRERLPDVVTLPQLFRRNGYLAARVGKLFHAGVPSQIGTAGADDAASWDITVNPRGVDRELHSQIHSLQPDGSNPLGGTLSWLSVESKAEDHTDGQAATAAIGFLEEQHPDRTGKPFFLAVGFFRPHTPFVAPAEFFARYQRDEIRPKVAPADDRDDIPPAALPDRPGELELTIAQRQEIIQAYYASISLMDEQVGRLTAALDRLGLAEKTIIVFLSDHGYQLGAHGLWQKLNLFEGGVRVPLLICNPAAKEHAGATSEALVELIDAYPTLADLCGLAPPQFLAGTSLAPILADPSSPGKEAAFTMTRVRIAGADGGSRPVDGHSIRDEQFRYTEWAGGAAGRELYDYRADPEELTNRADDPQYSDVVRRMRRLLQAARNRAKQQPSTSP